MWLVLAMVFATATPTLPIVAIDAGHGGIQGGAVGVCGVVEKDVTLGTARELAALLEATGLVVPYLTRATDETVSLEARALRANRAGATLFVSVHANASIDEESRGIETYFLSLRAANRRTQAVVDRENEGRHWEPRAVHNPVTQILDQLALNAADRESQQLATRMQRALTQDLHSGGRGVLQAPFIVLLESKMAAVLIEIGFLTNHEECRLLGDTEHQRRVARVVASGILAHLAHTAAISHRALAVAAPSAYN